MDRTLLPNGRWVGDDNAIAMFNELTERHELLVVYATGRSLALVEEAIATYGLRHPHVLIADVGASIRRFTDGEWVFDEDWIARVATMTARWDAAAIAEALAGIAGLREQEPEHRGSYKQSYYVDLARSEEILAAVDERLKGRYDEVLVYSVDSQRGLLDVLPNSATKQKALEYVAAEYGCDASEVVFCGDSGNDILPLTAGFSGVLVRNADDQVVASVRQAMEANESLRVYFAEGGFKGLSGYYASGVIEGAAHYGLFDSLDAE